MSTLGHTSTVLFLVAALKTGDVNFFAPADSEGRRCGIHPQVNTTPYLLDFCTETNSSISCHPGVCLKECPSQDFKYPRTMRPPSLDDTKKKMICLSNSLPYFDTIKDWAKLDKLVDMGDCAAEYKKSKPIDGKCVPTGNETLFNLDTDAIIKDIKNSWYDIQTALFLRVGGTIFSFASFYEKRFCLFQGTHFSGNGNQRSSIHRTCYPSSIRLNNHRLWLDFLFAEFALHFAGRDDSSTSRFYQQ